MSKSAIMISLSLFLAVLLLPMFCLRSSGNVDLKDPIYVRIQCLRSIADALLEFEAANSRLPDSLEELYPFHLKHLGTNSFFQMRNLVTPRDYSSLYVYLGEKGRAQGVFLYERPSALTNTGQVKSVWLISTNWDVYKRAIGELPEVETKLK